MGRARLVATALLAVCVGMTRSAEAEVLDDVERVAALWPGPGAQVERLGPLFLERGRAQGLDLAAQLGPASGCTSVLALGAASLEFAVSSADPLLDLRARPDEALDGEELQPLRSASGLLLLTRCGSRTRELAQLRLEALSPRGTVEILVARGGGLRELAEILPERVSGPSAALGDPGQAIEPGPLVERIAQAERRARAEGAERVFRVALRASPMGTGELILKLAEGCHRLEVMAEVPSTLPRRVTDVDAELRGSDDAGWRIFRRDRGDNPDARLEVCVGEPRTVSLRFGGASGAVAVTVTDAVWPIPDAVPRRWGARTRAGFASALARRRGARPIEAPVAEALGAPGVTSLAIEVLPGGCYLAAVALVRGETQAIRITAAVEGRLAHDDAVDGPEGAALAFCATTARVARLEVHTHGSGPWWALAVWPMGASLP